MMTDRMNITTDNVDKVYHKTTFVQKNSSQNRYRSTGSETF